jgi:signal transduction histidine kinase
MRFSALNVTLSYGLASIIVLALFATPLYYAWHRAVEDGRSELLYADSTRLTLLGQKIGMDGLATAIDTVVGDQPHGIGKIMLLAGADYQKVAGNLPSWPDEIRGKPGVHVITIELQGKSVRVALLCKKLADGHHLLVGNNIDRFERLEQLFKYGLFGCTGTFLLLAVAGGLVIRRALLARVHGIGQTTAAIVEGNLSRRLMVRDGNDELDMLAQTVNRMLDQIEHLVHGVRNVSNAIAHDLRTPLAELRYRLEELVLTRPPLEETYASVDTAIADVDQVLAIFNALLRLAEIDNGTRRAGFVDMDVGSVAGEVVEFYQPLAELKDVALGFSAFGRLRANGDPLLLAQAIGNLIDNALKYAPQQGHITVVVRQMPDQGIEVAVADDGPGIPDDEKSKVSERFYRSDTSRGTPGVGLGLSLVEAVARLHGGALDFSDNHPGLRAALRLASSCCANAGSEAAAASAALDDATIPAAEAEQQVWLK